MRRSDVYASILAADRESQESFSGHGSALAQAYNHTILPLSNPATSKPRSSGEFATSSTASAAIRRGCGFPRPPWTWQPGHPRQQWDQVHDTWHSIRPAGCAGIGGRNWVDVSGGRIDPTRPYAVRLPSGRKIAVFFYDGPISRAVAFEKLLERGEYLADRLVGAFADQRSWPQMVHIATDGETYGHHHRNGDMALAYALHYLEETGLARLTNYGEYLERFPPTHEAEIFENSAWSCAHGVERWNSDCGCNTGGYPGWNQGWRGPLRVALDWLRDALAPEYERRARRLLKDPWAARDDYVSVVLDRSPENIDRFFRTHASRELDDDERTIALKLLEIQRNAMLMYTSCGWFFDELSGIETVQVIQYAGRAIQLAAEVMKRSFEAGFLELLEQAKSNIPEHRDGRAIYEKWVRPSLADLPQVGAHYAISSLFEDYGDRTMIYCYEVDREDYRQLASGRVKLALGRVRITSQITCESERVNFGVLHLGDHNLSGGVQQYEGQAQYLSLAKEMGDAFSHADLTEVIRVVDRNFGTASYTLKLLFKDEQRKILGTILDSTLRESEALYRQVYENHVPLMRFLTDLNVPLPTDWLAAARVVINNGLQEALRGRLDTGVVAGLLEQAGTWRIALDAPGLAYTLKQTLAEIATRFGTDPRDIDLLRQLEEAVDVALSMPFEVDFFKPQNVYYGVSQRVSAGPSLLLHPSDERAREWMDHFSTLGEKLGVRVVEMREKLLGQAPSVVAIAEEIAAERRVPLSTYRLQFNRGFSFADARALVPYLNQLGTSDYYASPVFRARSDSSHGYDICVHDQLNPVLGGEGDFDSLARELREKGMGLLLDMVPNHMGIGETCNSWWMDVLENGPSSIYASYFDIDWHPMKPELNNKVLLPILEDQYGKVLDAGKLRLSYEDGAFYIEHYDSKLPVAPRTYSDVLSYQLDTLTHALGEEHEHVQELRSILTALGHLPPQTEEDPERIAERNREKEIIKRRIDALYQASRYVRAAIDTAVEAFNGVPGDSSTLDLLDQLLTKQAYRPAFWRVAAEEINYRRFFDINDLAAIRVERPEVFLATHRLALRLLAERKVTGLRIDHPDGLWNPMGYFRRLQEAYLLQRMSERLDPDVAVHELTGPVADWMSAQLSAEQGETPALPLYVVAEKILSEGEPLPREWAVDGTTGYDFLNTLNGLFVDHRNAKAFDRIYGQFIGNHINYRNLTNSTKKMIMLVSLASEINALARQLERVAEKNRLYRDFTLNSLTFALREVIAALQVYRTYITGPDSVDQKDREYVHGAVVEAKRRNPRTAEAIFDFIGETLLLRNLDDFSVEDRQAVVDFVMKFQQVTGPVMAKGVEDTAFYVYNRLVSLNEVGGHPDVFGVSAAAFHERNAERMTRWPHSMLATSTHDTKRSEDVRARIDVLSEVPNDWKQALDRWSEINQPKKTLVDGELAPDRNDEYMLYQLLLGAWPDTTSEGASVLKTEEFVRFRERVATYMRKATKEAKVHTSWVNANEEYDGAVQSFVQGILEDDPKDSFIKEFLAFQRLVGYFGRWNSLSQLVLKLTSPGVPDIYQGCEMWDLSMVDPDNRRPVDYARRQSVLSEISQQLVGDGPGLSRIARELLKSSHDGRIKLFTTWRTLGLRRSREDLFARGEYQPLHLRGAKADHAVAFQRTLGDDEVIVVAPRLVVGLTGRAERPPTGQETWQDTILQMDRHRDGYRYRNIFTGEILEAGERDGVRGLALGEVLARFPVAVLERVVEQG